MASIVILQSLPPFPGADDAPGVEQELTGRFGAARRTSSDTAAVRSDSIHIIPSLDEKPPPSKELPDLESKPKKDPFQPPFVPEELVGELDKYSILVSRCPL